MSNKPSATAFPTVDGDERELRGLVPTASQWKGNDNSWWSGAGAQTGSNTAFPLFAQMNVDSSHWYALWVWCGGGVSACGFGSPFWGSNAGASMSVTLPSMTWELF
jgi:hypothetical protein